VLAALPRLGAPAIVGISRCRTEGDMCQQSRCAETRCRRARENREYVRRLLSEREPAFLARLRCAVRQVELELARRSSADGQCQSPRLCDSPRSGDADADADADAPRQP
jgi:hypothetical protein